MKVEETGIENMRIPPYEPVVTDQTGSIYVDWSNTFERYEYGDVGTGWDLEQLILKVKTVIIGVTAEGISPLSNYTNGIKISSHDIQASVIHTLTGGKQITRSSIHSVWVEVCLYTLRGTSTDSYPCIIYRYGYQHVIFGGEFNRRCRCWV